LSFGNVESIECGAIIFNPSTGLILENIINLPERFPNLIPVLSQDMVAMSRSASASSFANVGAAFDSSSRSSSMSDFTAASSFIPSSSSSSSSSSSWFPSSFQDAVKQALQVDAVIDHRGKIIIPGFVDAHCHAPQYVFTGTGMDLPLLNWLEKYTFPSEAKFKDPSFAREAYRRSVCRHLRSGTTFASYFATIHDVSSKILCEVVAEVGQRAHVGKVSMDRNSPDYYIETTADGCNDAESFVRQVLGMTEAGRAHLRAVEVAEAEAEAEAGGLKEKRLDGADPTELSWSFKALLDQPTTPRVIPAVTPRFVPTCTSELMLKLGEISNKYGLPLQSHLSESPAEIEWVKSLHPDCDSYGDVYFKHQLLHPFAYMAHCCHSDAEERALLQRTGTGVVHCPSSNFMLGSGVLDVRGMINEGIKVALGTDVAGGYSPSMLDALRQTIIASHIKEMQHRDSKKDASIPHASDKHDEASVYSCLSVKEAFHLATVGGAEVLGMGRMLGNFFEGKKLDCLVIDVERGNAKRRSNSMNDMGADDRESPVSFDAPAELLGSWAGDYGANPVDVFGADGLMEKFEKFLFLGDDRNVRFIYIDGKCVLRSSRH